MLLSDLPGALGIPGDQATLLQRDPLWRVACEECGPQCLKELWPFLGALLNQSNFIDQVGRERLRPLFRCTEKLHERGTLAQSAAEHWKRQWYNAYGAAVEEHQKAGSVTLGSQVAMQDLHEALAAACVERDRLAAEVASLHQVLRTNWMAQMDREQENSMRLRTFDNAVQHHIGNTANQHFGILQRLHMEEAKVRQLQVDLNRAAMQLAGEAAVRQRVEEQLFASEQNVMKTRLDAENKIQHAIYEQRRRGDDLIKQCQEDKERERDLRSLDPTREEAMLTLRTYAELWRCACTPYVGLHGRRAEHAVRELMQVSNLLSPQSELVQEPLRRCLGEDPTKKLCEVLMAEAMQGLGPSNLANAKPMVAVPPPELPFLDASKAAQPRASLGPPRDHTDGSWCRWEDGALMRQPLHSAPPVLQTENR